MKRLAEIVLGRTESCQRYVEPMRQSPV